MNNNCRAMEIFQKISHFELQKLSIFITDYGKYLLIHNYIV